MAFLWTIIIACFIWYYNEHRFQWYKRKHCEQLQKDKDERQASLNKKRGLKERLQNIRAFSSDLDKYLKHEKQLHSKLQTERTQAKQFGL